MRFENLLQKSMLDILKSHYKRFGQFSLVGVLNTLIDFTVFYFFIYIINANTVTSQTFAFIAAVSNSYIFNSRWTFKGLGQKKKKERIVSFFMVALSGFIFSTIVLLSAEFFLEPYIPDYLEPKFIPKLLATFTSFSWNYCGSWLFVFKEKSDQSKPT